MQETYYKRTMLRKGNINLRKAKIQGMYAIDLSTAYICLYQELNLKIVKYTSSMCWFLVTEYLRSLGAEKM